MPTPAELRRWPFLSIVAWPQGWGRSDVAALLAEPGGLDAPTLSMRLGQKPPMVLERVEPSVAPSMIAALIERGGDGFLFTLADLAGPGATLGIRDLTVGEGILHVDLREGLQTTLRVETVQVLVRARLVSSVRGPRRPVKLTGARVRQRSWDSIKAEVESSGDREVSSSDKLDLHTSDGSVYQIDGDRFAYQALGALRGHSDNANMDSMCELLAHLCRDAVVDTYYELWRPPPGHEKLVDPNPRFAFYSRWAALVYRHIRETPPPQPL